MAVNRICYKDGKKILLPVLTRKEYIELRDSRYNLECLEKARKGETFVNKKGETVSWKTRLVQFNYSCYPNEDGTLQGSVRPADTVAMDIDFHAPEQLPEGMTEEKWLQDEILNTCENILNHKACILSRKESQICLRKPIFNVSPMCWECLLTQEQRTSPECSLHQLQPTFSLLRTQCSSVVTVVQAMEAMEQARQKFLERKKKKSETKADQKPKSH